ncbi:MAG: cupin domain-containing protein [Rhodospirillaceae bacterium]|nr:cupin domain-containing protein [Rhodospirillaceae bacterium]
MIRRYRRIAATAAACATLFAAGAAIAGECPAGQMRPDARTNPGFAAKGVTDKVLAQTDLGQEKVALKGHNMRVRRLVIQPGGIVPWHSHGERPALIYIISGQIFEYRSTCAMPILHKAGEVAREVHTTAHWWKNTGRVPVVLLSFDIMHDPRDHNM